MRINDSKYGFYSYQNQQNRSNIDKTTKKTSTSTPAEVNISSRGREISQAMMSEQAQRTKRVQELKQQIADGNYHVDSSKIADKLTAYWKNTSI
ncbi:flagellar biosynthesis anti-sigma factor FlgM [Neobacillus drentensis]|uniref:flagellar biosynthesis anti-sigma factor FlgM n=1 Tax=Neobacillus drentensis TaxID=220684 RepID=UPI002FFEC7BA